jgi:transcriptional regulator GlxA family with amidase domain
VHADRRIVDNGKIVVVGGESSGIDGALYLVDRLLGRSKANATARYVEYNWPAEKKN